MSTPIKVGDKVLCIDDAASFGRLYRGEIYEVEANFDGSLTVISRGSSHSLDRFELQGGAA